MPLQKSSQGSLLASTVVKLFYTVIVFLVACTPQEISITSFPNSLPTPIPTLKADIRTSTQTPKPTLTSAPTPTMDIITTLAVEFDIPAVCLFTEAYLVSKDGNWIGTDCKTNKELMIAERSSGEKTNISYQEVGSKVADNFSISPLSWSSDNRYFYFTTRCCEYYDAKRDNGSLYRFDTTNKAWKKLIHGVYKPLYFFSNDGQRYVFLNHYPSNMPGYPEYLELGMIDTVSNKNKRAVFRYIWGPIQGDLPIFAWSENGENFVLILHRLVSISNNIVWQDDVLLKIDFKKWEIKLVEEFNENSLLEE